MNKQTLLDRITSQKTRSAWSKGVKEYAFDLVEDSEHEDFNLDTINKVLLNGASDWDEFSYGGSALIYDCDIAERLCSPSELKKCKGGERNPNRRESWFDCQARALFQAYNLIKRILMASK